MTPSGTTRPSPASRPAKRLERPAAGRGRMLLAGSVSLLVHAVVATLLLAGAVSGASKPQAELQTKPPPPESEEPLTLGSDRSESTSITWIGFEEYQEHVLNRKSEVDQPELIRESPGGVPSRPAPPALTQSPPAAEPAEAINPQETTPQEVASVQPQESPPEEPLQPEPPAPVIAQSSDPAAAPGPAEVATADEPLMADRVGPLPPEPKPDADNTPSDQPQVTTTQVGPPAPESVKASEPATAAQPPAPPGADPGAEATGEKSDRESDASATITATVSKLGRPLVAHGLEIQTIRPRFTYYTQVTASPRSPIVRVQFDGKGKVYKAQIVQSSGSSDVDRPLLDAIYQWRASGKQLEGLSAGNPPETVAIEFRILL